MPSNTVAIQHCCHPTLLSSYTVVILHCCHPTLLPSYTVAIAARIQLSFHLQVNSQQGINLVFFFTSTCNKGSTQSLSCSQLAARDHLSPNSHQGNSIVLSLQSTRSKRSTQSSSSGHLAAKGSTQSYFTAREQLSLYPCGQLTEGDQLLLQLA